MRYGYWLPVFGGWLRNVEQENMTASWEYASRLAIRAEEIGFDLCLVAELNLNDIKGADAPALDAWSTAAALAAVTRTQEIMVAVRPTFHSPALLAKQAANIDHISGGRLSLNVVSSWWADEAKKYGVHFEQHDDRYARTEEWLTVLNGVWQQDHFSHQGRYYQVEDNILQPKPVRRGRGEKEEDGRRKTEANAIRLSNDSPEEPNHQSSIHNRQSTIVNPQSSIPTPDRPLLYAGGESEAAKNLIARTCDGYVMHGDPPEKIGERIRDMNARRDQLGLKPMLYGVAAYSIVRDIEEEALAEKARITDVRSSAAGYDNYQQWLAGTRLEQQVSLEDYSVSNRGLRCGLVGTATQVQARIAEFEAVGVDFLLLQCSPQLEEMERFAAAIMG